PLPPEAATRINTAFQPPPSRRGNHKFHSPGCQAPIRTNAEPSQIIEHMTTQFNQTPRTFN
ncbi:MAG: hypothetical protein ACKPKO_21145, partial [Candidatus Fonsibacter sp.]